MISPTILSCPYWWIGPEDSSWRIDLVPHWITAWDIHSPCQYFYCIVVGLVILKAYDSSQIVLHHRKVTDLAFYQRLLPVACNHQWAWALPF